jgi:hypothetical protein
MVIFFRSNGAEQGIQKVKAISGMHPESPWRVVDGPAYFL